MTIAAFGNAVDERLELRFGGAQNGDVLTLYPRGGDTERIGGVACLRQLKAWLEVCTNDNKELFHEGLLNNSSSTRQNAWKS